MADSAKPKKLRLYKFASEVNLSTESLIDFLTEKGYDVKSKMSPLTEEMIADINTKFKKEIEKAEKHYKKLSEFQKKRNQGKEEAEEEVVETPKEEPESGEEPVEQETENQQEVEEITKAEPEEIETDEPEKVDQEIETVFEADAQHEKDDEAEEETVHEESVEEEIAEENEEEKLEPEKTAVRESQPEEEKAEEEPKVEKPVDSFKTPYEIAMAKKKSGLKVVGKIDLDAQKKKKNKPKLKKRNTEEDSQKDETEKVSAKQPAAEQSSEDDNSNKKRKKLKAKKRGKDDEELNTKAKKTRKLKKQVIDKREVENAIKRTLSDMEGTVAGADRASVRKKKKKEKAAEAERIAEEKQLAEETKIQVTEFIAVSELANLMNVPVNEVLQKCFQLGMMVSINQRIDVETITLVADEFGFEVEFQEEYTSEALEDFEDGAETLKPRPPVVTIMGHVDHGKTSLLDYIRRTNVVAGESGGITQHIGAYQVTLDDGRQITFLDTPGHEAFTAMRARGASVTDIVVLVVAADDAVMPQTVEAINHAQAAGVPMVIAINKIDKPGANTDKIRQQLADRNILVEDWGGKYQTAEVSAKSGFNVEELLEKILLEAEMLDLKANPDRNARGTIIESQLDKGRGITATVLIEKGTLRIQDPFVAGVFQGRVRAMFDERNKPVSEVGPAAPVLLLGFEGSPQAGDSFVVVDSEREAREIAITRQQLKREQEHRQVRLITLDEIANQISMGGVKELPLVVKGDVDGSVEALADSLMKLSNQEVVVRVIHKGVGGISEGDVLLAAASGAIIIGFHVRPYTNARKLAENENVDIRLYNVIYDAINEVKSALEGLLSPIINEQLTSTIEVRDTFKVPKVGTVAGCYVTDGKISRNDKIRLFRDGINIYEGELATLKRFKDDVKEVDAGYECGLNIHNFNDIKVGDVIESYKFVETKKKLDS